MVSRDVQVIFKIAKVHVAKYLQEHTGRLHICIDGWTSPNVISFLGITVQRVVNGRMEAFVLDFILVKGVDPEKSWVTSV
ncbi:hypothetical protein QCA50_003574 [Cerrena zonata]|uniref:DUF659 domain-containing protein n=1 Tax=Cerrena zonata TaxID=2478898 RepID=A0AAW0GKW6_9APHY